MPLHAGTRLGPYEIQSPIGAGGMGEVYLARDTRLDRSVAIKVLSSEIAADAEFRERFEREARTLSHLNHRHVCTLYDVGDAGGAAFLVMEYLEGETLATRLARSTVGSGGALPVVEAVRIGTEIASALDAAHRLGITHRDLKPGNVMLTRGGAKLVDFGLAKAHSDGVVAGIESDGETRRTPEGATPLTAAGHIVGTLRYMAPEQIEGRAVDARTDVFSFGALMYEMVAGRAPFQATSQAGLIGSILKDESAPPSSVQPAVPPALDFLILKCLAKDPDDRWQSARDLKGQLEWIASSLTQSVSRSGVVPSDAVPASRRRARLAWLAGGAAVLAAAIATAALWPRSAGGDSAAAPDVRFHIDVPSMPNPNLVTISPDGRLVAFIARKPGTSQVGLWVRPLNATAALLVPDTDGAYSPFWSPDSRTIAFGSQRLLKRVGFDGLPAEAICTIPAPYDFSGGTWAPGGTVVFSAGAGLFRVAADGGEPVELTRPDAGRGEVSHYYPSFLPDGRHFLFLVTSGNPASSGVYIGSIETPDTATPQKRTRILDVLSMAAYAAPGYLIYQNAGILMAAPFDAASLQLTGAPVRLVESISFSSFGRAAFAVSSVGTLAYRTGEGEALTQLTWFDRAGKPMATVGPRTPMRQIVLSPDGKRVALDRRDPAVGTHDIWLLELASGVLTRVTLDPGNDADPTWSPDSRSIAFLGERAKPGIYLRRIGSDRDELVYERAQTYLMHWAPDGRLLYHTRQIISALPIGGTPEILFQSPFRMDEAHVSADGHWVAYNSDESSRVEVHVASYPAFEQRRQVSSDGGGAPWWRADGRELFYLSIDGKLMSVPVTPGPAPEFGTPVVLFQSPLSAPNLDMDEYAVSADGQRFLIMDRADSTTTPITVVLDWRKLMK